MAAFEYLALNAKGKQEKGLLEGDTARQVRDMLRGRGLAPLDIRQVADSQAHKPTLFTKGGSLSTAELSLFTHQLATLVRSGLPLDESLTAVAQHSEGKRVQRVTLGVRAAVVEGSSLAQALGQFPNAFPNLFRATIEAGEHSGKLDGILERLADYVENRQVIRQKISAALIYPIVLLVACVGIVMVLLTSVVPQVVGVFEDIGQKLPPLTLGLIAMSDFLRDWWGALLFLLVAGIAAFAAAMRGEPFKRMVHRQILRMPVIGRLTRGANTGRFTRTLGILTTSGVPILDAMQIGSQVVSNLPMREAVEAAAKRVREGGSVNRSLAESKLFPPISIHLIASGEQSGKLGDMLERAAENQEREIDGTVTNLLSILAPLMIMVMGGMVLLIVLAILLPIFDLNSLVK